MKRISTYFLGAALAAAALSGCAAADADADAGSATPSSPTAVGDTTTFVDGLLTYQPTKVGDSFIGMTAQMQGTLTFDNGCLLVDGSPVVFPADDTSWDGTTLTSSGNEFVVGDEIVLGGGAIDRKLPANTPDQCGGSAPFYGWGAEKSS